MKKTNLILAIFFIASVANSQDFSFDLIFTDAIGNRDTLVLGYDDNAGDSIDTIFGEKNIINTAWSNVFEVRIGSENFETKTQIKENKCKNERIYCSSELYVLCKHWPLTISWNSSLLNNSCSEYSVLTDCLPGGWFDTEHSFIATLALQDTVVVKDELYYYHMNNNDTIRSYYIDLGNVGKYGAMYGPFDDITEVNSNLDIKLFPNPTNEIITINTTTETIKKVIVYNLSGIKVQEFKIKDSNSIIDLTEEHSGIYMVTIETTNGIFKQKIIKE